MLFNELNLYTWQLTINKFRAALNSHSDFSIWNSTSTLHKLQRWRTQEEISLLPIFSQTQPFQEKERWWDFWQWSGPPLGRLESNGESFIRFPPRPHDGAQIVPEILFPLGMPEWMPLALSGKGIKTKLEPSRLLVTQDILSFFCKNFIYRPASSASWAKLRPWTLNIPSSKTYTVVLSCAHEVLLHTTAFLSRCCEA